MCFFSVFSNIHGRYQTVLTLSMPLLSNIRNKYNNFYESYDIYDTNQSLCAYCGMDEIDLCSPFVVGQCRSEHEAHIALCKSNAEEALNMSKGRDVSTINLLITISTVK